MLCKNGDESLTVFARHFLFLVFSMIKRKNWFCVEYKIYIVCMAAENIFAAKM